MAETAMDDRLEMERDLGQSDTEPVVSDALCPDDEIEEVPRHVGRPIRSMSDGYARGSKCHAPKCWECPKWIRTTSVCPIRGAHQNGQSPACRYGIVVIRAKRMADRRAGAASSKGVKKQCQG
jgi:hypothetical protein